jgi:hypothetical protein
VKGNFFHLLIYFDRADEFVCLIQPMWIAEKMLEFFSPNHLQYVSTGYLATKDVPKIFPDLDDDVRYSILRLLIRYDLASEATDIRKMVKVPVCSDCGICEAFEMTFFQEL